MAGYSDTRKMIIDALMGRPEGTQIQPEDHQAFALQIIDYIRSVELVAGNATPIGFADADTVPVQPYNGQAIYLSSVSGSNTITFTNFIDQNANAISVTSTANVIKLITLLWNGQYWSSQVTSVNAVCATDGYLFAGVATKDTDPNTPDTKIFYIADGKGVYTNFDGISVTEDEVVILYYDTAWHKEITGIASNDKLTELESEINTKIAGLSADMCWIRDPKDGLPFTQDYEEGLQDCYIDSNKIQNISKILIQCYILNSTPCLYIRYESNTGASSYLVSAVPFSNINNFEQFNIFKDNECVGYVIFKDKQKFIDNPRTIGIPLNLKKVLRGNVLNGFSVTTENIQDNCITTEKIVNGSITTEKIVDKGVTADKTDFVEVRPGNQLYDKSSMGVKGSWYYFGGAGGIGKEVSLLTNEHTGVYTAIKIPYNGQNQITLSQDIPEQNGARLYAYYIVDTNMRAIAYQTAVQAYLIDGYTITIETNQDAAYLLLSVSNCNEESFMVNEGDVVLPYEPYQKYTYINGIKITDDKEVSKELDISLPDTIHAVVGDTLQLFYRGMVKAVNPYNYDILVNCIKGKQYPRYYEFTPTSEDVGSIPFKITIKDNNRNVIAEKSCIINVVNVASSPISVKKIACFGDSLTYNGAWVAEAYRRLTQTGGSPVANGLSNIEFVGAKEKNGARYFGEGGWTWDSYTTKGINAYRFQVNDVLSLSVGSQYTNNGNTFTILEINITNGSGNILCSVSSLTPAPSASGTLIKSSGTGDNNITFTSYSQDSANPLWDSNANKMTFIPYANKYANGNIDIVYTLLSWNGQIPGKEDFSDVIAKIKIFADTLHTEFPNAKLKIMGIQVPSVNGGMGANYGATGTSYSDGYGMVVTALNQNKAYQDFANSEGYKDFVEFVNVSAEFDTEYNMPYSEVNVNTRSTIKEKRGTNGVHPSNEGYLQIADVVYRNMMANL